MPDNTQKRITQAIALGVHNHVVSNRLGTHELVVDAEVANTGVMSAPTKDEVVAPRRVRYSFQRDYASFRDANRNGARTVAHVDYANAARVDDGIAKVVAFLVERA